MATLLTDLDPRLRSRKKIGRRRIFAVAGQIGGKQLVQLILTQAPSGEQYTETEIDFTGLIITAEFSDETSEVVNATPNIVIWGSESVPQTVTFSYGGKTVEWTTTPTLTVPTNLAVTGSWTNKQIEGRPVDTTGLSFTATYNNSETKTVTPEVSPSVWSGAGVQTATFLYTYNGVTVTTTSEVYVREMKFVGILVKRKATKGEKYITSIFYGQKASSLTSSSVVYEFYYTNDNGATFTRFYSVNAKDIVDGNGKTGGSTALAINEVIQAEITAGRATGSSIIYYAVIDEDSEYQTNSDAYASFYMYIPADSGVNVYSVGNVAKSAGSSFSKGHYGDIISGLGDGGILRDNYEPTAGGDIDENQPTAWARLSWNNTTPNVQRLTDGSIGESNFSTGRTILSQLTTWIGNDATKKGYYYGGVSTPKSAWDLLDLANNNQNAIYDDWFIPSFGEIEQMRGSFGYKENSNIYFGKAILGDAIYNTPGGTANTIVTSSVGGTNTIKSSNKYKVAIFWSVPTMDCEQAWFAGVTTVYPCNSLVLVRTF